ncbi:PEP-CTERM sorting domain-containing protein [Sedimentitalea sp. HM32M-2]|uniref:PEP-CTERM sorting domain-containing protein n=1 Tax=Sedimentitalea sp. HM32M-2 TaxID=3351566 RepID=UPI00362B38AC
MLKKLTATAFAACLAGTTAGAATFDFGADANAFWFANASDSRYEGTFDQVYGISTVDGNSTATAAGTLGGNSKDGITVTASATKATGAAADPFMDSRGPFAGLGVCSSGLIGSGADAGKSQCSSRIGSNPGDDNLVSPEELKLSFNLGVELTGLQIRDADHNLISNTTDAILINGVAYDTGANGQVILTGLGAGGSFLFTSNGTSPGKEIYLSVLSVTAQVPVPASLPLLVGGLGLMGWAARRRKPS